jgi:hypothetical protein
MVLSRLPAPQESTDELYLIPAIDMLNHSSDPAARNTSLALVRTAAGGTQRGAQAHAAAAAAAAGAGGAPQPPFFFMRAGGAAALRARARLRGGAGRVGGSCKAACLQQRTTRDC